MTLTLISFLSTIVSFGLVFFVLRNVGKSTYSVKLHQHSYILNSTVLLFLFGALVTYFGYLLLVYPYTNEVVPSLRDGLVGLIVISLYVVSLAGVNAVTVGSRERRQAKEELVTEFLDSTTTLAEADLDAAKNLSQKISSSGEELEKNLRNEPVQDMDDLACLLRGWLDEFEGCNPSDQRRMVGWTSSEDTERNKPWKTHYSNYGEIKQELSKLKLSSEDEVENVP